MLATLTLKSLKGTEKGIELVLVTTHLDPEDSLALLELIDQPVDVEINKAQRNFGEDVRLQG